MSKVWIDGNSFVEAITAKDIKEELYGDKSITAKYTQRINWINAQLKADAGKWSKPGRPRKIPAKQITPEEQGMGM